MRRVLINSIWAARRLKLIVDAHKQDVNAKSLTPLAETEEILAPCLSARVETSTRRLRSDVKFQQGRRGCSDTVLLQHSLTKLRPSSLNRHQPAHQSGTKLALETPGRSFALCVTENLSHTHRGTATVSLVLPAHVMQFCEVTGALSTGAIATDVRNVTERRWPH